MCRLGRIRCAMSLLLLYFFRIDTLPHLWPVERGLFLEHKVHDGDVGLVAWAFGLFLVVAFENAIIKQNNEVGICSSQRRVAIWPGSVDNKGQLTSATTHLLFYMYAFRPSWHDEVSSLSLESRPSHLMSHSRYAICVLQLAGACRIGLLFAAISWKALVGPI